MVKHSIASNTGGILNPKGFKDLFEGFKKYDENDPVYQEYVKLGLSHKYSMEAKAETQMTKAIENWNTGNIFGAVGRGIGSFLLQNKWIPASPGQVKWMFEDYIPTLKFERVKDNVAIKERQLGRPLTDGEKINQIRQVQQFYGEMNERLYGRSGTVTSVLRLVFMAPGYGEGNFKTTFSSMNVKDLYQGKGESRSNLKWVVNSLATTATLATIGTLVLTGKPPETPKRLEDVRDLFKIQTGKKDGSGDDIYVDLMTFDKDFWAIYGNVATGQIGKVVPELTARAQGAASTGLKVLTDLSDVVQGRVVYDYKGDPVYYTTDSFPRKVGKFLSYEMKQGAPISTSVYGQSSDKGTSTLEEAGTAITGLRPTTSEKVKEMKLIRNDLYSMKDQKQKTQIELNRMAHENPKLAEEELNKFNQEQTDRLKDIYKKLGREWNEEHLKQFTISKVNIKEPMSVEESLDNVLTGKKSSGNRIPKRQKPSYPKYKSGTIGNDPLNIR